MSETPISPENPNLFDAYSGTTLENYRNNAFISDEGKVFYNKSRMPEHDFPETFFDTTLTGTFRFTAIVADEMHDTPVIMAGWVDRKFLDEMNLPPGTHFPVERLWVPKEGCNIEELVSAMIILEDKDSVIASLVEVDPRSLLVNDKKE